jgi:hypothetical protein
MYMCFDTVYRLISDRNEQQQLADTVGASTFIDTCVREVKRLLSSERYSTGNARYDSTAKVSCTPYSMPTQHISMLYNTISRLR